MNTAPAASLKDLTDDEVNAVYQAGDAATQAAALREMQRRDTLAAAHAAGKAWWARVREEWELAVHAQFLAAEARVNGNYYGEKAKARNLDPRLLWTKDAEWAWKNASEEMQNFWQYEQARTPNCGQFAAYFAAEEKRERDEAFGLAA